VKVILFGSTGMVGQGVLRECLLDPEIAEVLAIGRSATGQQHTKLRELVRDDLFDLSDIAGEPGGLRRLLFLSGGFVGRDEGGGVPARDV
jgi:uncharacterized protein YbjT (DUF2867 family)